MGGEGSGRRPDPVKRWEANALTFNQPQPNDGSQIFLPNLSGVRKEARKDTLDPASVPSTRTLTAGAGLTGGGDLSADRTFDVGAGTGITVNANDVALTVPVAIANGGTNNTSAYTAGSVIFSNGTSLTQDNANLFWDDTTNRLGIGTASPSATDWNANARLLHISQATTDGAILKLSSSNADGVVAVGNDQMQIGTVGAEPLSFWTNTTERMTILSGGNVGIGTTSPAKPLHIANTGTQQIVIQDTDTNAAGENWYFQTSAGNFFIGESTNAGGAFSSLADRFTILTGGNVGIGTTSPTNQLTLGGGAVIEMSNAADTTPTISLSGGLFISGGALFYRSDLGTIRLLAAR